jgi:hypothetical protein
MEGCVVVDERREPGRIEPPVIHERVYISDLASEKYNFAKCESIMAISKIGDKCRNLTTIPSGNLLHNVE